MRRECAPMSSVKTGSTFSSSAIRSVVGRSAARAMRSVPATPERQERFPLVVARNGLGHDLDDRLPVIVSPKNPGHAATRLAIAGREREVEVVEHPRDDV